MMTAQREDAKTESALSQTPAITRFLTALKQTLTAEEAAQAGAMTASHAWLLLTALQDYALMECVRPKRMKALSARMKASAGMT
jgi:hypothetical protein